MSFLLSVAKRTRIRLSVPQLLEDPIWTPIRETGIVMARPNEYNDIKSFPIVVGLHGLPGSGKDTLADVMMTYYNGDFQRVSFAGPLKKCMSTLFGVPNACFNNRTEKEKTIPGYDGLTPRIIAQRGGDALKAAFGSDFLVDIARYRINRHLTNKHCVVVTDIRFTNEAKMIKEFENSIIIKLDAGERVKSLGSGASHHSNNPLPDELIDYTVSTECTIAETKAEVIKILMDHS